MPIAAFAPQLLEHARADQIASLYRSWHRTTLSMVLGALILCGVLWDQEVGWTMTVWLAGLLCNQAWRGLLGRAHRRAPPPGGDAGRRARYWATGSATPGGLLGWARAARFPAT